MGPPTFFFLFSFLHKYAQLSKYRQKSTQKIQTILKSSGGADRSSGGLSGIMCKQLF